LATAPIARCRMTKRPAAARPAGIRPGRFV